VNRKFLLPILLSIPALTLACIALPGLPFPPGGGALPSKTPIPPTAISTPSPTPAPTLVVIYPPPELPTENCGSILAEVLALAESDVGGGSPIGEWHDDGNQYDLVAYDIQDGDILNPTLFSVPQELQRYQNDTEFHRYIWSVFDYIIPPDQRTLVSRFTIFTDGQDHLLASVNMHSIQPEGWTLNVDVIDSKDPNELTDFLVHEYGHVLTLNSSQFSYASHADCQTYTSEGDCSLPESYLNRFYERFWVDVYSEWESIDNLTQSDSYHRSLADFYARYSDRFVTRYAATSPEEDIAEAWMFFIFTARPDGATIAEQKILFFYEWPELVNLRDFIYARLCTFFYVPE